MPLTKEICLLSGELYSVPRHATSLRVLSLMLITLTALLATAQSTNPPAPSSPDTFTEAVASRLLSQVAEGLQARVARKMLSAFDLTRMQGGEAFRDHIAAFINQTDSIRVHFKLREITGNTAVVDVEMDVTPRDDIAPPQRKTAEVRFTADKGNNGWRFIDVQPRNFFSL